MSLKAVGFIELPGGRPTAFDHADTYFTTTGSRMYVAHTATNAVDVIDCGSGTFMRSLPDLPGVAGVLIDSERDLLFTSDRDAARVSMFRCSDETLLGQVNVGARPNGLAFDTRRRNLYSFNLGEPAGTDPSASVVSVDERRVIATIQLPGRPRWAVFDRSSDSIYVNIQSPAVILVIDAGSIGETRRIEVGAEGPHGLGLAHRRLFCAADEGELVVIDPSMSGRGVIKRLPLPGAPDVVMLDERTQRLFVAIGSPGVVSVFDMRSLMALETIETERGAHTVGWDPAAAKLYVFAPQRGGAVVFSDSA